MLTITPRTSRAESCGSISPEKAPAAAGAVGSIAVQPAKLWDCQVIGSAGGPHKLDYLREELGLSHVFDDREGSIVQAVRGLAPDSWLPEASMQGFRAGSFLHLQAQMQVEIGARLLANRMTWRNVVFPGVEAAPEAMVSMLNGGHVGKTLCSIDWQRPTLLGERVEPLRSWGGLRARTARRAHSIGWDRDRS